MSYDYEDDLQPEEEPTDCGRPNGRLCAECDICDVIADQMLDASRES